MVSSSPTDFSVSKATQADLPQIKEIQNAWVEKHQHGDLENGYFESKMSKNLLKYAINNGLIFVARLKKRIVGYLCLLIKKHSKARFNYTEKAFREHPIIHQVAVHPEFARQNIGTRLYKSLKKLLQRSHTQVLALVRTANTASHIFHKKSGFSLNNHISIPNFSCYSKKIW